MTQSKPAICNECRKDILAHISHHSLTMPATGQEGVGVHCHEEPVSGKYIVLSFALKIVLEQINALRAKNEEILASKQKGQSDTQANEAVLKRKLQAEADQKLEVTRLGLVTTHETLMKDLKRQLADAEQKLEASEQKCSGLEALHADQVDGLKTQIEDLKTQLAEAEQATRGAERTSELLDAKLVEAREQLAASERSKAEFQRQAGELTHKVKLFDRLERALRKRTHEFRALGVGTFSQTIRIGHIEMALGQYEKLYGTLPEEPKQDLETLLKSIEKEEDDAEAPEAPATPPAPAATAPKAVTTPPATMPVPKTAIATATAPKNGKSAYLVEVHTPVPPVRTTVQLDGSSPGSTSDASADDEDDGDDHRVDDHQVIDTKEAEASAEEEHAMCTACPGKPAVGSLTFVDKNSGEKSELFTCDPQAHTDVYLRYLQQNAKGKQWSNMDKNDIPHLFT